MEHLYGSLQGVKDTLPRFAEYIKPDAEAASDPVFIKESTITSYLEEATSQIDAALSGEYVTPVLLQDGKHPRILDTVANNLAAYKLAKKFWTVIGNEENHSVMALRKDAKEILDSLEGGTYHLPGVQKIGPNEIDELDQYLSSRDDESIFDLEDPVTWLDKL